jgi:SM-20-related protein
MDSEHDDKHTVYQFESLIQGLMDHEYGCCDDFINQSTISGLRNNINRSTENGAMKASGVGNRMKFQHNQTIRGDNIMWLQENSENQYEAYYQKKLNYFISHLNSTCYTSINKFESHYASYPQNSFYKRHLDQFKYDKGRKFSVILYLNDNWLLTDGGLLSLYPKEKKQIDISPIGGRLVFFRSDELEHEVHPSLTRSRISISGWFKSEEVFDA